MPTISRVRRKRGPALTWAPTQDSYYELAQILRSEGRLPLYLTQPAIFDFEAHLRESSLPLPFGLLAGEICICPDTKVEYVLIDTVARARIELGGDDPYVQLAEELQSLAADQSRQQKVAVGWYLGGLANDLTLDDDVARLHGQLFPERWQVALVRGSDSGTERGAFLRYESIWSRWYSIPFFEFLSEGSAQKKGEPRTAIRWENYRTDEPTRPLDESDLSVRESSAPPRRSWGARLFGASLEPLGLAARGTPRRAPERAQPTSAPAQQRLSSAPPSHAVAPAAAARPTVTAPPARSNPLEIAPSPLRPADLPPVRTVERKVAAHVDRTVIAPIEQTLTAAVEEAATPPVEQTAAPPAEPKVTAPVEATIIAPVEATVTAPVEEKVTAPAELRVAPTPELKVASTAELKVASPAETKLAPAADELLAPIGEAKLAAPADVKLAPRAEVRVAATVAQTVASVADTRVAREEPQREVQHLFIDGGLVSAPLDFDLASMPATQSSDRMSVSWLVAGALLLLILIALYFIAS